uniref:hypothetical protein n=1 Tax=Ensifer aridi TaxID=1708715 RepID=UPI001AED0690
QLYIVEPRRAAASPERSLTPIISGWSMASGGRPHAEMNLPARLLEKPNSPQSARHTNGF